jgi:hypothetical protein
MDQQILPVPRKPRIVLEVLGTSPVHGNFYVGRVDGKPIGYWYERGSPPILLDAMREAA